MPPCHATEEEHGSVILLLHRSKIVKLMISGSSIIIRANRAEKTLRVSDSGKDKVSLSNTCFDESYS